MSKVTHVEEFIGTNGHLVDERFGFMNDMLKSMKAQVQAVYEHKELNYRMQLSQPSAENSGIVTAQVLTPYGASSPNKNSELFQRVGSATLFMHEIMVDNPDSLDCVMVSFPDGQSIVLDRFSDRKIDASGKVLPYDARKEQWYQDALENKETFSVTKSYLPCEDTDSITVSTAVYDGDKLVCVLGVSVKTERILEIIKNSFDEEGIYPVLIDETGTVLFSLVPDGPFADSDVLTKEENAGNEIVQFIIYFSMQKTASIEVTVDGQEYYSAFTAIPNAGWAEVIFVEKDLFEGSTNELMDSLEKLTDKTVDVSDRNFLKVLIQMLVLSVILIGLSILISILVSKRISRPIKRMTKKVSEIDGEKILFEMEEIFRTGDEIETLAAAFEAMSQKIRKYIADIVEISTQKERMETELKVATQIQSSMLPKGFPLFPDRTEFDVYASMDPAREVGGDFYDIFMTDEDHLVLVVGDASEKGVPAALFMVITKAFIKTRALTGGSPGKILTDVNNLLTEGNDTKMFVTVWLAILEISTGRFVYANAGHEKPAIKRADDEFSLDSTKHGFVLGGLKDISYSDYEISLYKGDKIFMYTDGLTEAHKDVHDLFGSTRMLEVLNKYKEREPKELALAVKSEVMAFSEDAPQFDDMTMLVLEYK